MSALFQYAGESGLRRKKLRLTILWHRQDECGWKERVRRFFQVQKVVFDRRVWNHTVRMTWMCCGKHVECWGKNLKIGNSDVFIESVTIALAFNKVLRKRILKRNAIGLIPSGRYSRNVNYTNKAIMWLVYRELIDGCRILHARNGREYRPPEIPTWAWTVSALKREICTIIWLSFSWWYLFTCSWRQYLRRGHLRGEILTDNDQITTDNQCRVHCRGSDGTWEVKTVCTVRGITLNYKASQLVKFDRLMTWF